MKRFIFISTLLIFVAFLATIFVWYLIQDTLRVKNAEFEVTDEIPVTAE